MILISKISYLKTYKYHIKELMASKILITKLDVKLINNALNRKKIRCLCGSNNLKLIKTKNHFKCRICKLTNKVSFLILMQNKLKFI